jgi:hypothetical protein
LKTRCVGPLYGLAKIILATNGVVLSPWQDGVSTYRQKRSLDAKCCVQLAFTENVGLTTVHHIYVYITISPQSLSISVEHVRKVN